MKAQSQRPFDLKRLEHQEELFQPETDYLQIDFKPVELEIVTEARKMVPVSDEEHSFGSEYFLG